MNIYYQYNRNNEIADFLKTSFEELTSKDYTIPITFSDEIPPIFTDKKRKFEGKELDEYPIDELMGAYFPETRRIVIYLQGINRAVKELTDKIATPSLFENLMMIVVLHEIGHFWFHNVTIKKELIIRKIDDDEILNESYFAPEINNPVIGEWIAQMFAFFCLKNNVNLLKTMTELAKVQPNEYRSYQNYNQLDINDFKKYTKAFQCVPSDYAKDFKYWASDYKAIGIEEGIKNAIYSVDLYNKLRKYPL